MQRVRRVSSKGFALPTVLIASVVLLTVLAVSVSATATARTTLKEQYYAQLAQIAGEAGVAYAKSCLAANENEPQWTDAKPLTPSTDCAGNPLLSPQVRALVVAGGGGGGGAGSGGGGGGVVYDESVSISTTSYSVTVGGGGAGGVGAAAGTQGGNSVFAGITATGGGRGATHGGGAGGAGGSGGGGAIMSSGGATAGGVGSQGFNGGTGPVDAGWVGMSGGGGGAGGAGQNGANGTNDGGNGGPGALYNITGGNLYYAAGGGAGEINGTKIGTGGSGIGGSGVINAAGTAGDANTGAGGGGGSYNGSYFNGGAGGSGVVVIAYPNNGSITATGGTITTSGIYKIHRFTTSGTFTVTNATASSCPTDPRCYVTVNDNVRSSFSVAEPDLDTNGKALAIPNSGYVEVIRTSNGAVWRTYTQPSVQSAVVPELCSGSATSALGWNNAVRATTQDTLSLDSSAQSITIANGNVMAGPIYFRKDFSVNEVGTYDIAVYTPSSQDGAELYIDGILRASSTGSLDAESVTLSTGCHNVMVVLTNLTIRTRAVRLTAAIRQSGSDRTTISTDPSWRVSAGESEHYSDSSYYANSTYWTAVRDVNRAAAFSTGWTSESGDAFARQIVTTHNNSSGNYPSAQRTYMRDSRDVTVTTPTDVRLTAHCDDSCTIYLDGQAVLNGVWASPNSTVVTLQPGTHHFGAMLYNGSGPSGLAFSAVRTSDSVTMTRTDARWVAANFWEASLNEYYSYRNDFRPNPYPVDEPTTVRALIVGGGGGGGEGGGGGGGVREITATVDASTGYTVTVGTGGTGSTNGSAVGTNGTASQVFSTSASGGGRGGVSTSGTGASGGSGGGGRRDNGGAGGSGSSGQGFNGGGSTAAVSWIGGAGGGGAAGLGGNGSGGAANTEAGGYGGPGHISDIMVVMTSYGGGGAGGTEGTGGGTNLRGLATNGGGNGYSGQGGVVTAQSGSANTGGGGGGRPTNSGSGTAGNGGSGVVIISYRTGTVVATGGTITTVGGYTIHRFTASGTFTVTSIP